MKNIHLVLIGLAIQILASCHLASGIGFGSLLASQSSCNGVSQVNIVAHQDDDILFIDPAITDVLRSGGCVTTIFMTSGSFNDFAYMETRESASLAAYQEILGSSSSWMLYINELVVGGGTVSITTRRSILNPKLTIVYMRLPQGNVRPTGAGDAPLADMFDLGQTVSSLSYTQCVDGPANDYSKATTVSTLTTLIDGFGATQVNTLNPDTVPYFEHPDHIYAARFARLALRAVTANVPVAYHETYPSATTSPNVLPTKLQTKRDVNAAYFNIDGGYMSADGATFSEATYNGHWMARRNFKTAMAYDTAVSFPKAPIVNMETQQCITSMGLGATPAMAGCTNAPNQLWTFISSSVQVGLRGTALIQSSNGNCLAVSSNVISEKACDVNDQSQLWTPWNFGKIFGPGSQTCLDTDNTDLQLEAGLAGDVVGDGGNYLVQVHRRTDGPGVNVWVSKLVPNANPIASTKWYDGSSNLFNPAVFTPSCGSDPFCYDQSRYLLADFTGDGKADLMVMTPDVVNRRIYFWLLTSSESGFNTPILYGTTPTLFDYDNVQQFLVGSFSGTGRMDIVIAYSRGDGGLNLWVMSNSGTALNSPVLWAQATGILRSSKLFTSKVNNDAFADVIVVDWPVDGLRISTFTSNGNSFSANYGVQVYNLFVQIRSKVVVSKSLVNGLTDVWVLHARADGPNINFWQVSNNGAGGFNSPAMVRTETTLSWSDTVPIVTSDGSKMVLPYRVNNPISEYVLAVGPMGVKSVSLSPAGLQAPITVYGVSNIFLWTDLQWRQRLN
ncbi:hypothetical protein SAMD00019534_018440 [Acytostelium subglobosum LB1]|uniref:hypothetical protein n=1 Tax=Acytostelium subglobosum LB1 TaxID=1410327 RepID=UPI0006449470|nr:hypothetical protein SAMD00019534_018440 [Acytostelium subglobosum LB1]GAM18669.1 hypothetical protein SAMD00019534_018440 [Acytostelium subglobosum LB1]|eukprot:XP_012757889.1 hypothetical protein SAMD00019534_018440 [Acytostelium subglobosum LB1]